MERGRKCERGFTLIELLAALVIFGLAGAAVFTAYNSQVKQTSQAFGRSKSQMDLQIAKNLLERDIMMSGFGLAEEFTGLPNAATLSANTRAISAVNAASDTLTMMGTALGIGSRAAQGWTVSTGAAALPVVWTDSGRDNMTANDRYVAMDPFTRRIVTPPWERTFNAAAGTGLGMGTIMLGLDTATDTDPHYRVTYSVVPGINPITCAPGTQILRRDEARGPFVPNAAMMNCVLNMQVAFGLDTNDDDMIDVWDNGGAVAGALPREDVSNQLKQVRVYVLVQGGQRDPSYDSYSPIRVGDADLGIGNDVDLTLDQRQYRWELLSSTVTPRNIR